MLSEKGEKQDRFVIYLLSIEVFIIILIVGIAKIDLTVKVDLAVALGTISMALAIVYIEIIKPSLQKPKIKIEFKNEAPFCRDCLIEVNVRTPAPGYKGPAFGYFIRLKIRNIGGSLVKNLRGKLVKVIDRYGEINTDFDPLFLHWVSIPRIKRVELDPFEKWLDPIDLNVGEWEYLDVFNTLEKLEKKEDSNENSPKKEAKGFFKGRVYIGTKEEARVSRNIFNISEGLKAFKITIYGDNIEPVTETYKLTWDGENYNEIEMHPMNQKGANNG